MYKQTAWGIDKTHPEGFISTSSRQNITPPPFKLFHHCGFQNLTSVVNLLYSSIFLSLPNCLPSRPQYIYNLISFPLSSLPKEPSSIHCLSYLPPALLTSHLFNPRIIPYIPSLIYYSLLFIFIFLPCFLYSVIPISSEGNFSCAPVLLPLFSPLFSFLLAFILHSPLVLI